jgi:hypothetical protein
MYERGEGVVQDQAEAVRWCVRGWAGDAAAVAVALVRHAIWHRATCHPASRGMPSGIAWHATSHLARRCDDVTRWQNETCEGACVRACRYGMAAQQGNDEASVNLATVNMQDWEFMI